MFLDKSNLFLFHLNLLKYDISRYSALLITSMDMSKCLNENYM